MKSTKVKRHEIYSIQGEIIKKGLYYCIVEVKHLKINSKILNKKKLLTTVSLKIKKKLIIIYLKIC